MCNQLTELNRTTSELRKWCMNDAVAEILAEIPGSLLEGVLAARHARPESKWRLADGMTMIDEGNVAERDEIATLTRHRSLRTLAGRVQWPSCLVATVGDIAGHALAQPLLVPSGRAVHCLPVH